MTVKMSSKGQVVIPRRVREQLHLEQGAELALRVEGPSVILEKVPRRDWRRWEGVFAGLDLLGDHLRQRKEELRREKTKAPR